MGQGHDNQQTLGAVTRAAIAEARNALVPVKAFLDEEREMQERLARRGIYTTGDRIAAVDDAREGLARALNHLNQLALTTTAQRLGQLADEDAR